MAGKTKEAKRLDALEARVRALEAHNGWKSDDDHADDDDEPGDGKDADDEKDET